MRGLLLGVTVAVVTITALTTARTQAEGPDTTEREVLAQLVLAGAPLAPAFAGSAPAAPALPPSFGSPSSSISSPAAGPAAAPASVSVPPPAPGPMVAPQLPGIPNP